MYVPLDHKGIGLLSCVSSIYIFVLKTKFYLLRDSGLDWVKMNRMDLENFKSCIDHSVSPSIIRNQIKKKMTTIAAFFDFKKRLIIWRDILYFSDYSSTIVMGKVYNSITCKKIT